MSVLGPKVLSTVYFKVLMSREAAVIMQIFNECENGWHGATSVRVLVLGLPIHLPTEMAANSIWPKSPMAIHLHGFEYLVASWILATPMPTYTPIFPFNPPPLWELWAELTAGIWSLDLYRFCQTKHEFALLHTYMWVTEREKAAKADLVPFSWSEPPAIRLSP